MEQRQTIPNLKRFPKQIPQRPLTYPQQKPHHQQQKQLIIIKQIN
jgi:hypothetical protein